MSIIRYKKHAVGCRDRRNADNLQIAIRFDSETFAQIRAVAQKANISFSEQVRLFCEWGLEDKKP